MQETHDKHELLETTNIRDEYFYYLFMHNHKLCKVYSEIK